jgi:hypothetical protein
MGKISHWHLLLDQVVLPQSILDHRYRGDGTGESPYVVEWLPSDPRNPFGFSMARKVFITLVIALASLSVSFSSSAYLTPAALIAEHFETTTEVSVHHRRLPDQVRHDMSLLTQKSI